MNGSLCTPNRTWLKVPEGEMLKQPSMSWRPTTFGDIPMHWSEENVLPPGDLCPLPYEDVILSDQHFNSLLGSPLHQWDPVRKEFVWYQRTNHENINQEATSSSWFTQIFIGILLFLLFYNILVKIIDYLPLTLPWLSTSWYAFLFSLSFTVIIAWKWNIKN